MDTLQGLLKSPRYGFLLHSRLESIAESSTYSNNSYSLLIHIFSFSEKRPLLDVNTYMQKICYIHTVQLSVAFIHVNYRQVQLASANGL